MRHRTTSGLLPALHAPVIAASEWSQRIFSESGLFFVHRSLLDSWRATSRSICQELRISLPSAELGLISVARSAVFCRWESGACAPLRAARAAVRATRSLFIAPSPVTSTIYSDATIGAGPMGRVTYTAYMNYFRLLKTCNMEVERGRDEPSKARGSD